MSRQSIPTFATEAEEAAWWFERREETARDLAEAAKAGTLGTGSRARYEALQARRMKEEAQSSSQPEVVAAK